jgi:hypothetical protein
MAGEGAEGSHLALQWLAHEAGDGLAALDLLGFE